MWEKSSKSSINNLAVDKICMRRADISWFVASGDYMTTIVKYISLSNFELIESYHFESSNKCISIAAQYPEIRNLSDINNCGERKESA